MTLRVTLALALAGIGSSASIAAQAPLYMPRSVKAAYQAGTRSPDGTPGPAYWQNRASYRMTIDLAPTDRMVRGTEEISYHNASPDTLRSLVIKLFLNNHKAGAPRNNGVGPAYLTDGIRIDRFTVNGTAARWGSDDGVFTSRTVRLPTPLLPGDSVRLGFDWHVELARQSNREGMLGDGALFLAYFYPRVAVYDDAYGWDTMDFTDSQEFYSDFNDYDVTIRVPRNFVVWGTGTLREPETVLQQAPLARYLASFTSDTVVRVADAGDVTAGRITRQDSLLAWRFTGTGIPDVAFGVSNHYTWDAGSVVVDARSGRRASVQAAYVDSATDFRHMITFAGDALTWFSRQWPGVPYPYEKTTVFQGVADMEYPMMVNDNSFPDTSFARFVAAHEIAHTWFPFYMGINETRHAFMDEGWATALEYLFNTATMGRERADGLFRQFRVNGWIRDPSPLQDLPIMTPADMLKGAAYGNNAYGKPALGYLALKDLLGDATFTRALQGYIERWHGKHPLPWDFFNSVNDLAGQDLDWFWRSWFFEPNYIDLAVETVRDRAVTIRNLGGMPAPFDLVVTRRDGTTTTVHQTSAVWRDTPAVTSVMVPGDAAIRSVRLEGGIWMDADPSNNAWEAPR
ncbi:MAG: M1 family metallopeptidase [Gemmatimonadetes bacterium]|nr:M1 family metallopeptidase [Gemmatimonadota bacterium]